MEVLKCVSLNVRGINNNLKCRRVYRYMKLQKADVCFLQECHGVENTNDLWASEWGNKCLFANGHSNAKGVGILLNNKCAGNISEVVRDHEGRFIICKLQINEYSYCMVNVYAPNGDEPLFFENILKLVAELDCVHVIIDGDFNVAINPNIDRSVNNIYNENSRKIIVNEIEDGRLSDIWRVINPEKKAFMWMRGLNVMEWSRIDYFLISNNLVDRCTNCEIMPSVVSDHSMISVSIETSVTKRGPGIWRFNNELLNNKVFCDEMEDVINGMNRVYNYLEGDDYWEILKFEITHRARKFAANRSYATKMENFQLYRELSALQDSIVNDPWRGQFLRNKIVNVQNTLKAKEILDAKRSAFRCKVQWTEYGEIPSSYYFNLEKRNYTSKTMYVTRDRDGSLTKDYTDILRIQYDFFSSLYKKDESVEFSIQNLNQKRLTDDLRKKFDSMITKEELYDAMMTLKGNKAPGSDGLTLEFYKKFWKLLVNPLYDNYVSCMAKSRLNASGRQGLINLFPKRNKNLEWVKNWRPICLLNYCYKIWAKAISNRLEEVSGELIGPQQTGFIKKRSIFTNLRTTAEIITNYSKRKIPGLIVLVDFEKCFDRVNFDSIRGTFRYFGFGDDFINMMFLLFNNLEICTSSNGFCSQFFDKRRGVNQGCPASPQIYCYTSEIMSHLIYQNPDIRGLDVYGIENILSQFADDTSAYLKYEKTCIEAFAETLACIERQMGLKVSYDKTTVYRIGSLVDSDAELITQKQLKWSSEPLESLGIKFACDGSEVLSNYEEILTKIRNTCKTWVNRRSSMIGKILIINTLIASLFVYKVTAMLNITTKQIKEIESLFRDFIWDGKKPKVSLKTVDGTKGTRGTKTVQHRCQTRTQSELVGCLS